MHRMYTETYLNLLKIVTPISFKKNPQTSINTFYVQNIVVIVVGTTKMETI